MARTSFADKRIVVTGGSSGLGLALAKRLATNRARVALLARDSERLKRARDTVLAWTPEARLVNACADVVDNAVDPRMFADIAEELGGIDLLINSAGILREGYSEQCPDTMFREVMDINYLGVLNCTRAALPHLKQARGTLVNVASIGGLAGAFGYTAYNASRWSASARPCVTSSDPKESPSSWSPHRGLSPRWWLRSTPPERRRTERTLTIPKHDVDTIAQETLRGSVRGRFLTVPGRRARVAVGVMRHLPSLTRGLGEARVRRVYQGPSTLAEPASSTAEPGNL